MDGWMDVGWMFGQLDGWMMDGGWQDWGSQKIHTNNVKGKLAMKKRKKTEKNLSNISGRYAMLIVMGKVQKSTSW